MTSQEKAGKVIELARSLIGTPYKYGALMEEAPNLFDCSGFIQYIFQSIGVELPRSTILQASYGQSVSRDELSPGDLVFLHGERGYYNKEYPQGIGHVLLYIGDGKVIQAASQRVVDHPDPIEEKGAVVETALSDAEKLNGPIVVIKRVLS